MEAGEAVWRQGEAVEARGGRGKGGSVEAGGGSVEAGEAVWRQGGQCGLWRQEVSGCAGGPVWNLNLFTFATFKCTDKCSIHMPISNNNRNA